MSAKVVSSMCINVKGMLCTDQKETILTDKLQLAVAGSKAALTLHAHVLIELILHRADLLIRNL